MKRILMALGLWTANEFPLSHPAIEVYGQHHWRGINHVSPGPQGGLGRRKEINLDNNDEEVDCFHGVP